MIYVNPDDFLGSPRIFTPERNRDAWQACKDLVEKTLDEIFQASIRRAITSGSFAKSSTTASAPSSCTGTGV